MQYSELYDFRFGFYKYQTSVILYRTKSVDLSFQKFWRIYPSTYDICVELKRSIMLGKPPLIPLLDFLINSTLGKFRIAFSRCDRSVSEKILDCHHGHPSFQHMHCTSMSHCVWSISLFYEHGWILAFCDGQVFFENSLNTRDCHLFVCLAGKDMTIQILINFAPEQILP